MKAFGYERGSTVEQVVSLLDGAGDGQVRPLAGGTDLLTLIKADIATPERLVDIKRAAGLSSEITLGDDGITIGALATLTRIERDVAIRDQTPALAEAASLAASPQLRNMATIGGNLLQRPRCWYFRSPRVDCWLKGGQDCPARDGENQLHALFGDSPCVAVHPSDPAAVLLAYGAEVTLRGRQGERTLPLSAFFALPEEDRRTENVLHPDELVLSVRVPMQPGDTRSTYLKAMDRKVWAFALVGVATVLRLSGDRIESASVVLSGVAPIPWRAAAAEQVLVGQPISPELFARAAEAALADARPLGRNGYKIDLAKALIRRSLAALTIAPEEHAAD